jgi:hypothetical protein
MHLSLDNVNELTGYFDRLGILPADAKMRLLELMSEHFVFKAQLVVAESIHLHIKVPDTDLLPHENIMRKGANPQNAKEGYIKYVFPGGYNFIFSSIPVSQEEKLGINSYHYPHLDHIGIDIRDEREEAYSFFQKIPCLATSKEWPSRKQGGDGKKVSCCHVQVNEKYWVYPPGSVYLEFAFGRLFVNENSFGCDLRPADPSLNIAEEDGNTCCGTRANVPGKLKEDVIENLSESSH